MQFENKTLMEGRNLSELPLKLLNTNDLKKIRENLLIISSKNFEPEKVSIYAVDFVILGVLSRTFTLIDGFILQTENNNYLCAAPLVRLQLDTLFRLHILQKSSPEKREELSKAIIKGEQLNKIRGDDNKPLTDGYLKTSLSNEIPWVSNIYDVGSKYIHFSLRHIFNNISNLDSEERTINISLGDSTYGISTVDKNEMIDCMTRITQLILDYTSGWVNYKRKLHNDKVLSLTTC